MEKKFTWANLKRIANRIPDNRLKDEVVIWTDDEKGYVVKGVEVLKEDYLFDGDEASAPRSVMRDIIKEEKQAGTYEDGEYPVVHPKGRRILYAEL